MSAAYCALQVNGILEAYVHASASSRQLVHINIGLVVFAAVHLALSVLLVRLGDALGERFASCQMLDFVCCRSPGGSV